MDRIAIFVLYIGLSTSIHCLKDCHLQPFTSLQSAFYSTTIHCYTEGHRRPLIVLQRTNNDYTLSYIGPTTTTHSLTEGHQPPLIVLHRTNYNHSQSYRGLSTTTHNQLLLMSCDSFEAQTNVALTIVIYNPPQIHQVEFP